MERERGGCHQLSQLQPTAENECNQMESLRRCLTRMKYLRLMLILMWQLILAANAEYLESKKTGKKGREDKVAIVAIFSTRGIGAEAAVFIPIPNSSSKLSWGWVQLSWGWVQLSWAWVQLSLPHTQAKVSISMSFFPPVGLKSVFLSYFLLGVPIG
jgi:hypothetical protein